MGSNEGCAWMSLGGVGHVQISEGFFGLTYILAEIYASLFKPQYIDGLLNPSHRKLFSTTEVATQGLQSKPPKRYES